MKEIKDKFIEVLGVPHDMCALDEYISFVIENSINEQTLQYCENHHILPQSLFIDSRTYKLTYEDHVNAHRLLINAYPIREFIRPLNFMLNRKEKESAEYRKLISISAKLKWVEFKKTESYIFWKNKRSEYMSQYMKNGGSVYLSKLRYSDPKNKEKISKHFKTLWQDESYRNRIIQSMLLERNSIDGKIRMKKAAKNRWENMDNEKFEKFKETMKSINSSREKRKDAGDKIKELWDTPEFKDKMKNRKPRGSDGTALKTLWADPIFRQKMIDSRKNNKK